MSKPLTTINATATDIATGLRCTALNLTDECLPGMRRYRFL
jgi:hypothetical protein